MLTHFVVSFFSNTNAGIPGQLTGEQLQKETGLTAATLVAHVSESWFDGTITYDAEDDGNQVGALGSVETFSVGLRNPFGIGTYLQSANWLDSCLFQKLTLLVIPKQFFTVTGTCTALTMAPT